jgi:hypothetical protein
MIGEEEFHQVISLERKRTEHTGKPFLLMLLDMTDCIRHSRVRWLLSAFWNPTSRAIRSENDGIPETVAAALSSVASDTDVTGWYKNGSILGVMFREFEAGDRSAILSAMTTRVSETLRRNLSKQQFGQIQVSFHLFPEEWKN